MLNNQKIIVFLFALILGSLTLISEGVNKKEKEPAKKEILNHDNSELSKLFLEKLGKPITKEWNTSLNEICKDISKELDLKVEIDKVANAEGFIELNVKKLSGTLTLKLVLEISGCVGNVKEGVLYISLAENK